MLRDPIRNRAGSYARYICTFSLGLWLLESELHWNVTHIAKVIFPEEIFQMTFINHLIVFNGKTSGINERVHAFLKNYAKYRLSGAGHRGDADIYAYRAKRCLTNVRNHKMANLDC